MCLQIIYIISKIDACLNKILDIKYIYYDTFHHHMQHQFVHPKKLSKLQEYFSKSLAFPTQISYNRTAQKNIFFRTTHKSFKESQTNGKSERLWAVLRTFLFIGTAKRYI